MFVSQTSTVSDFVETDNEPIFELMIVPPNVIWQAFLELK